MVPAPRCAPPMGSARVSFSGEDAPAPRIAPSMGSARVSFSADEVKPPPSRESQRGSDGIPSPNKARARQSIEQAISNAESELAVKKPPHPGFSKSPTGGYSKP